MKTSTVAMTSMELLPVTAVWLSWPRRIAEQRALWKHFGRHWYVYLPLLFVYLWGLDHIGVNWTPSLPYHVVYIEKHVSVGRGDLVVFRFEGGEIANHFKGQRFFKRIAGVTGDEITLQGRNILINGAHVGFARSRTPDGRTLDAIEPGVIPADRFYVQGTHEMSFDSRYRVNGLVRREQIIGKATVIF
jgi:conjugal transfer pilin signal peptidase TrbI